MIAEFQFDVFLSHSAKDKAVVRPLAERLRLTFSRPSTISPQPASALLNQKRRFIPLRRDDASNKGSLAQFRYINWRARNREQNPAGAERTSCISGAML